MNVNSSLLKLRISKCPLRGRETYFWHNSRGKGHPYKYVVHSAYTYGLKFNPLAELCKAGLRKSRVSARFELRYESLKSISVLILFVCKFMIGS